MAANRAAAARTFTLRETLTDLARTWLRLILSRAVESSDVSDTVAAITGAVAGVYLGASAVPEEWVAEVHGLPAGADGAPLCAADLRGLARATALAGLSDSGKPGGPAGLRG